MKIPHTKKNHLPSDHSLDFNHLSITSLDPVVSNAPCDIARPKPTHLQEPVPAQAQGYQPGYLPVIEQGVVIGELPHPEDVLLLTEDCSGVPHVGHVQVAMEEERHDNRGSTPDLPVELLDLLHLAWVPLGSIGCSHLLQGRGWDY